MATRRKLITILIRANMVAVNGKIIIIPSKEVFFGIQDVLIELGHFAQYPTKFVTEITKCFNIQNVQTSLMNNSNLDQANHFSSSRNYQNSTEREGSEDHPKSGVNICPKKSETVYWPIWAILKLSVPAQPENIKIVYQRHSICSKTEYHK